MRKDLKARVLKGEIVDTKKYRYIMEECGDHEKQWQEIRRLPIDLLDTTAALDSWETIEVIK